MIIIKLSKQNIMSLKHGSLRLVLIKSKKSSNQGILQGTLT